MSFLLDTHVWIWAQQQPEKLGTRASEIIETSSEDIFISTISTLELARLIKGGLIIMKHPLARWVTRSLELLHCSTIEVSHRIAIEAYALPGDFHKDPADRIIAATTRIHKLKLLTADERLLAYPHLQTADARR